MGAFMHAKRGTAPVLLLSTLMKACVIPWLMCMRVAVVAGEGKEGVETRGKGQRTTEVAALSMPR